ncbi:MAG: VOC family protein [Methylocystis sp.]
MAQDPRVNRIDYIEFPAGPEALAQTKDFFGNVFGWSYQDWRADYADTQDSGVASGLNADAAHKTKRPLAVIFVMDLEGTRAKILAAGGTITREIFSFPGGRRFHFKDPAGNELGAWSDRGAEAGQ